MLRLALSRNRFGTQDLRQVLTLKWRMGRPTSPLNADQAERALAYLQRALSRKADLFVAGAKETGRSLGALRRQSLTLRRDDFADRANTWLAQYVTPTGRKTMLNALRQERIESKRTETLRNVRVSAATHEKLSKFATERGLSLSDAVAFLVAEAQRT